MELSELRQSIDEIDAQLVALVEQRLDVSAQIAAYKKENALPVLDAGREAAKLEKIRAACRPELAESVAALYREVFRLSRAYQEKLMEGRNG